MPSKRLHNGSSDSDEIEVLTFDQFVSSTVPSSLQHSPPSGADVSNTGHATDMSDANVYGNTDIEQPSCDIRDDRPFASKPRLYLMVLADFGLSFTWLCKFAVATYVVSKYSSTILSLKTKFTAILFDSDVSCSHLLTLLHTSVPISNIL